MIIHGDCLEKLKELEDNSVDSCVTDPPYELGFMGKTWDGSGIANNPDMWREVLRVLKPGGHLLSFSGTRTYHRQAVAIEDAGFEIRDMVEWVYGSGFPKSLNIGKAVDKTQGNERETVREYETHDIRNNALMDRKGTMTATETKGTSPWEGWGTALKPAHEPICLARKPIEGTVAGNVLKYGTGGINIDESRVEYTGATDPRTFGGSWKTDKAAQNVYEGGYEGSEQTVSQQGRFPANLLHDNSDEVVREFPNTKSGGGDRNSRGKTDLFSGLGDTGTERSFPSSEGSAARFFKSFPQECSLCSLPISASYDTMSVWKNTNVNNVAKSSGTTQATKDHTAPLNVEGLLDKNLVQNVKSAGNLCDLCGTIIAQSIAATLQDHDLELILGQGSISEHKQQILAKCLASFAELRVNTDTTPTIQDLSLFFGYVRDAMKNSTPISETETGLNLNRSLIYQAKASKSERDRGCEGMEDKHDGHYAQDEWSRKNMGNTPDEKRKPVKNNHPTVKPLALMKYLIQMITPEGGVVLDPFAGSGSTLVAAKELGYDFIGIEMTEEYIPIIDARLNAVKARLL